MSNVVNISDYRPKRETSSSNQFPGEEESLELMRQIIIILLKYKHDAQNAETAENMILLSLLFQSHINYLNGFDDDMFDIFEIMKNRIKERE